MQQLVRSPCGIAVRESKQRNGVTYTATDDDVMAAQLQLQQQQLLLPLQRHRKPELRFLSRFRLSSSSLNSNTRMGILPRGRLQHRQLMMPRTQHVRLFLPWIGLRSLTPFDLRTSIWSIVPDILSGLLTGLGHR